MNLPAPLKNRLKAILLPVDHRFLVLLLALLFIGGCASQQSSDPDQRNDHRKAAEANTSLGLEYMNRGQYEVALGKLKKAVREDPGYAPAHTVTAVLYERLGEQELAGKYYKSAYEADSADGDVNNNYGVYLCKTGGYKQAMRHFLKALDDPFYRSPWAALTNAGACAMDQGDLVAADDYLRRALKIAPDYPDALMTMADLNYSRQDYLRARAFMQRYEAAASHDAGSLLLAFKIETASGDTRAAGKYRLMLESNYSDTDEAAEVRRLSGQ